MKLKKNIQVFESFEEAARSESKDLEKMSYQKKSETITYLRECFYGQEATTGRVQRTFKLIKAKPMKKMRGSLKGMDTEIIREADRF